MISHACRRRRRSNTKTSVLTCFCADRELVAQMDGWTCVYLKVLTRRRQCHRRSNAKTSVLTCFFCADMELVRNGNFYVCSQSVRLCAESICVRHVTCSVRTNRFGHRGVILAFERNLLPRAKERNEVPFIMLLANLSRRSFVATGTVVCISFLSANGEYSAVTSTFDGFFTLLSVRVIYFNLTFLSFLCPGVLLCYVNSSDVHWIFFREAARCSIKQATEFIFAYRGR